MELRDEIRQSEEMIRSGRLEEAIELLHEMLAEDPDDMPVLLNVGIAYTENGENDRAIRALTYYVSRDGKNPEAWEALGCAHLRKQEYAEAEEYLNRARTYAPENASVLRNMSVLLSRTNRYRESFSLLKRAHELAPDDYLTTYALGSAYRSIGDTEQAQPLFQHLLRFRELPEEIRREAEREVLQLAIGW